MLNMDASEAWVRAWIKIACLEAVRSLAKIQVDKDKEREVEGEMGMSRKMAG
jgi:hypothetical protein